MVGLYGVHHRRWLAEPAGQLGAHVGVRALDFVGNGLADVVEHRAALRELGVRSELGRDHRGDV